MTTAPTIITGPTLSALATIPDASAAAAVALVPVNALRMKPNSKGNTGAVPIRWADIDPVIEQLGRIVRGPLAMMVIQESRTWIDAFTRHGFTTQHQTDDHDLVDLIVAHRGEPVTLPPADTQAMRPLIHAVIDAVSKPGDMILAPFALVPMVPLAIHAAGRRLTAVVPATTHARALINEFNSDGNGITLTDEERAHVLARVAAGESRTGIARSMGVNADLVHKVVRRAA